MTDPKRDLLRHTVATVAYRAGKTVRGATPDFAQFPGAGRAPIQILAHMGDLFEWALSVAQGDQKWRNSEPLPWDREVERFFAALAAFDTYLASTAPLHASPEQLFQGPVADALTHTGQLAMLRRLAGCPMRGENYFAAEVAAGRVGIDQTPPAKTFP